MKLFWQFIWQLATEKLYRHGYVIWVRTDIESQEFVRAVSLSIVSGVPGPALSVRCIMSETEAKP